MSAIEPQTHRDDYYQAAKFFDGEYKQTPANLDDIIKTCENLHIEEQHQLEILPQKYEHLFEGTLGKIKMESISLHSLQMMDPDCKPVHARKF
jgi:hypothetical protein